MFSVREYENKDIVTEKQRKNFRKLFIINILKKMKTCHGMGLHPLLDRVDREKYRKEIEYLTKRYWND